MASQLKNATSKIVNRIPSLNRILRQVPKEDLLLTLCLVMIVGIAVTVRALPYIWGYPLAVHSSTSS
jgi:hypothetical protein